MSDESCCENDKILCKGNPLALIFGAMLLRLWLAMRAIQTGLEKYAGAKASDQAVAIDGSANSYGLTASSSVKHYALENYHGVPQALMEKFKAEPFMSDVALRMYDRILGPSLIILGVMILLGIANRISLFLLGLLYISLTWGLILIKQDEGVAWLGVHMIMVVMALMLSEHNRLSLLKKW
jgi:thiosulfate dehydrogenase [quinone] large subunit